MVGKNNELTVVKKNNFVQEYKVKNLSLTEIRIINYLIAKIHSPKYDKEFRKFRFDIKEFSQIVHPDKKSGAEYDRLPEVIKKLSDKSAWKKVPSTDNPGKMKEVLIRWIERPEFENGYVTLELNPYLAPYLLEVDKNYFESQFRYTALAQSKYTIPLYELLKSWEKVKGGEKTFSVEELKEYMDFSRKAENIALFKRDALNPAVDEINEITDLMVSYEESKTGRKVTHIKFTIKAKSKGTSAIEASARDIEDPNGENGAEQSHENIILKNYQKVLNFDLTLAEVKELMKLAAQVIPDFEESDNKEDDIKNYFEHLNVAAYIKNPKHPFAYLAGIIKNELEQKPKEEKHQPSYDLVEYEKYDIFENQKED